MKQGRLYLKKIFAIHSPVASIVLLQSHSFMLPVQ